MDPTEQEEREFRHEESKRTVSEMLGEFCREAAVLVLVFGFLDGIFREKPMGLRMMFATVVTSALALFCGIMLERLR